MHSKMDPNLENNPRYPANNADPAKIAHRLRLSGISEIKTQIELVQTLCGQLMDAVNKLSWMQLSVDIEHGNDNDFNKKDQ